MSVYAQITATVPMSDMNREMSSASPEANAALCRGIDGFNRWRADAIGHIDAAIGHDPGFGFAHAVKGLAMIGGRNARFSPVVDDCAKGAMDGRASASTDEAAWIDIFLDMNAGRLEPAIAGLELHLLDKPTDVLAHRMLQQELFWAGEADWMRDVAVRAHPHWRGDEADYSTYLSVYAFSLEEAGQHGESERAAREAIEIDPTDPWGAHAVAHVLEMQGRHQDGIAWLESLSGNWGEVNQIAHHLWWHLCLFYVENGDHDRILHLLDTQVRNPESPMIQAVPDAYIDIQNVASMLARLSLRGVDVGDRWNSIGDVCAQRANNHASPFTSAHAVMTLAACERFDDAVEVLSTMESFAASGDNTLALRHRTSAVPAARGALAWFKGDAQGAIDALMPARRNLWRMGGSHAQRDVFNQILFAAARNAGRNDISRILIDEMAATGFSEPDTRTLYRDAA